MGAQQGAEIFPDWIVSDEPFELCALSCRLPPRCSEPL